MDFDISWLSHIGLNPEQSKNKETKKNQFRMRGSIVSSSWAPPMHTIFHWNLERNSLRTHLRKTWLSRNINKSNEIATFRHPRINITTSRSFAFGKTTSLLNTYEKTSKTWPHRKLSKTIEITTVWSPRTHLRSTPDLQNYLRSPPRTLQGRSRAHLRKPWLSRKHS